MPRYQVTLDGKTFVIEGDRPPTEAEARQAFEAYQPPASAEPAKAAAPEKSVGGFLGNAVSSTANLVKDSATGAWDLIKAFTAYSPMNPRAAENFAKVNPGQVLATLKAAPGAIAEGARNRYGGLDQIANTLYNDPAGALADISTLTGLGAGATAARAPRMAAVLRKAEQASDPLRAVTAPVRAGARKAGQTVVRGTLRPPKAVRESFGGSKGVADAVLDERVYSEASAQRKLSESVKQADDLLTQKQGAGVRGVSARQVAGSMRGRPTDTAKRREVLGVEGAGRAVSDRAQRLLDANAIPGNPNATRLIPLTEAQGLKREAQDLAYEASKNNLSLDQQSNQAIAQALREGIEQRVPDVKPINERSQRLLGAQRAFAEAEDRPRALTNFLSMMGGGGVGAATGDPVTALLMSAAIKGMDSPRVGAMAGIGLNEFGRGIDAEGLRRAALLARLTAEDSR